MTALFERSPRGETRSLVNNMKWRNPPEKSLKKYITLCICYLRERKEELRIIKFKVKRRDIEYFSKCIGAQLRKDYSHALLYASECLEMRKLFKIVFRCELALEQIIIRLETLEIFSEVSYIMIVPVSEIIKKVKVEIGKHIPKFSYQLEVIIGKLDNLALKTEISPVEDNDSEFLSESSFNIFEEAKISAEEEVKNDFPELPKEVIQIPEA